MNGVQVYKVLGYFKTKAEANAELVKYNQTQYNIDQKKLTFAEIYKNWSNSHFKDISQSSVRGYQTAYKHCKNLYNIRFADIRAVHLQRVINEDCETYSIRKSVRVLFNVLYQYAYDNDIVEKKYNKTVKIGKPVTVHQKQIFTDEEVDTLWENVDKIDGVDTILDLIYTGMRVTEFLEVENENIHLDDRYLIGGKKTTAGTNRVIPIHTDILPYIKKRYNTDNKYLITIDGKPLSYYEYKKYIWEPIMEQLGMNHTPHETRHSTATKLHEVEKYDKLRNKKDSTDTLLRTSQHAIQGQVLRVYVT